MIIGLIKVKWFRKGISVSQKSKSNYLLITRHARILTALAGGPSSQFVNGTSRYSAIVIDTIALEEGLTIITKQYSCKNPANLLYAVKM